MKLTFRPRAEADLAAIWDYSVATWSEAQAESYLRGLEDTLALLAAHPEMARLRPEFRPPVRLFPYRQHLVVFMAEAGALEVIRVLHARTDWSVLLDDGA